MLVEFFLLSLPLWFQRYKRNSSSTAAVSVGYCVAIFVGYRVGVEALFLLFVIDL